MNNSYDILIHKLDTFIKKYYKNLLVKGLLYTVGILFSFFLGTIFLEYFGNFSPSVRTGLFYSFIALSGITIANYIAIPILKLFKIGKTISHEEASKIVGNHFTDVQDKLLNILQLKEQSNESSNELILAGISQKSNELTPISFRNAIDISENKKYLKYAIPPLLLLLLVFWWSPNIIVKSTNRLVNHSTEFLPQAPFEFEITNTNLKAVKQEDFTLNITVSGSVLPALAYIVIDGNKFVLNKEGKTAFNYTFKNIQKAEEFQLMADGFYSKTYQLEVLPKPILLGFNIDLKYPKYIKKDAESLRNNGDIIVPEGTKITWTFSTKDVEQLNMRLGDSLLALNRLSQNSYQYFDVVRKSVGYSISTQNKHMKNKDSAFYSINVIPDQYPEIDLEERADSLSTKRIYFQGNLKDDYGVSQLTFNYIQEGDSINESALITEEIKINKTKLAHFFHFWDFSSLPIKAGDKIEYYFEVWDNDGVNGRKSTKTKKMVFKAPTHEELADKADKTNEEIKDLLKESMTDSKEIQEDLEELRKKLMEKKKLSWEDKKALEELLEKQKQLQENVENIQKENQQKINEQKEYSQTNENIIKKQEEIQKLFEQVMSEEMKELFKEMEEMMEKLNKEDLQKKLEEMTLSNEDIEKELDRTLELFKQLEVEQKMEEAIEKMDELAKEQEKLAEETKEGKKPSEELKKEQKKLDDKFEQLKKDMEELAKKNEELEEPNDIPKMEEEIAKTDEEQEKAGEELNKGKNKKAAQNQQNAADKMEEMASKMQAAKDKMEEEQQEEDINNLRQIRENLIQLSFDQEELMSDITGLTKKDPKYFEVGKRQKNLSDDAQLIEDSLFALSKRNPQIEASVNREIADINSNIEKALAHIHERQTPQAKAKQQYVMTAINNLALMLDESIQQMQQAQAQQKFGEGSCSKPGNKSSPKPGGMKKMQQQISKQIEQLKKEMDSQKGKSPGGKKGQGQMSKKLAQLAAEQEALRNEMQKLSENMKNGGENGAKGGGNGELEKLQELMEQNEKDLVNKNLTQETINRQNEIMTRLLEHEKAERERDIDDKRESKEAKNQNFSNPTDFFEYNKLKQKEAELLRTVPPTLNQFYKEKVTDYFNQTE